MSRPKPTVIVESINSSSRKLEQVLACDGVWVVLYNNEPFNFRTVSAPGSIAEPKYKRVSFSNPGHAINLAKKLNKQFKTDLFTVVLLNASEQVYP